MKNEGREVNECDWTMIPELRKICCTENGREKGAVRRMRGRERAHPSLSVNRRQAEGEPILYAPGPDL